MKILALNSGSSSQKTCLYEIGETLPDITPPRLWEAKIQWDGENAEVLIKNSQGVERHDLVRHTSRVEAVNRLLLALRGDEKQAFKIDVVGHRVVHGGPHYREPALVTPEMKAAIAAASEFAPLHTQAELEGMEIVEELFGSIPQVAVFDTGFYRDMPLSAIVYPGPYEWFERGIHRYGFHGINHEYCARRAAKLMGRDISSLKLVTCHLGAGCSLAAISGGRSIDTTMGFTPLEGLMMATRSGSIDPGILSYLMRKDQLGPDKIDEILNKKSGLLGIFGTSGDLREILSAMNHGDERAKLAFEMYTHRLQAGIGAMAAVLGGIEALVFTAGVGENSPEIRSAVCRNLEFLGLKLDQSANKQISADKDISDQNSRRRILVIHAQEEWAIAEECWRLIHTN